MFKIEHIGIAVHDLEEAEKLYEKLLGSPSYKREEVESEKVVTSFFRSGPNKVELLAATEESSAIHKYLEKKGEGSPPYRLCRRKYQGGNGTTQGRRVYPA